MELKFPTLDIAVFNCHVNNSKERALTIVQRCLWFPPNDIKALSDDCANGIMGIFHRKPDEASRMFAVLVFTFANNLETKQ